MPNADPALEKCPPFGDGGFEYAIDGIMSKESVDRVAAIGLLIKNWEQNRAKRKKEWDDSQAAEHKKKVTAARELPHPHAVVVAQINDDSADVPFRRLLILPTSPQYKQTEKIPSSHVLHPDAAKHLKIIDVVRLVGMILGVPALPSTFPPPSNTETTTISWISVHKADSENGIIGTDISSNIEGLSVKEFEGDVVYLKVHGKRRALAASVQNVINLAIFYPADYRFATSDLREAYTKTFGLSPNQCFLSGTQIKSSIGIELIHIIPFELGSSLVTGLMRAVAERCQEIRKEGYGGELPTCQSNSTNPIICGVDVYGARSGWTPPSLDPNARTVNNPYNIRPVDGFLHAYHDLGHGLLISTEPKLWLSYDDIYNIYTMTPFYKHLQHNLLPQPPSTRMETVDDSSAFLLASFTDAATLFIRFASDNLREEFLFTFNSLKERLAEIKQAKQKRKREENEVRKLAKKKKPDPDDGNGGGPGMSGGSQSGPGPESNGGSGGGTDDSSSPSGSGGGEGHTTADGAGEDGLPESNSGGKLSDSSSVTHFSLVGSISESLNTDIDEEEDKKVELDYPGLDYITSLFTSPAELVRDESSNLNEDSNKIFRALFNIHRPGPDDEQRLEVLHRKVQIYFAMLVNWVPVH